MPSLIAQEFLINLVNLASADDERVKKILTDYHLAGKTSAEEISELLLRQHGITMRYK